jgi:hypothetical protein
MRSMPATLRVLPGRFVPEITWHALQRWQERVDPNASTELARRDVFEFVACGRIRPTPRHWTDVQPHPGLTFVYWWTRPGVCALVQGGAVVTVVTRGLVRGNWTRMRNSTDVASRLQQPAPASWHADDAA